MKKPYKSYNGGKESDGTYQKIINIMPPHDIYIEAFLGNGAIFRKKKNAFVSSIGIDLDTAVIEQWIKLNCLSITLINTDAILWLEHFATMASIFKKMGIRVLIYLDPPYPKSSRRNQLDLYSCEMSDADHTRLLTVARSIDANVIISSYPNELYNETLKDWSTIQFTAMTRGGPATEKVWYNYPTPTELHDYRYLGNDYREREQFKGIVTRNVTKFKRLPDLHRNAIIQELRKEELI
jgi:site-specific DNA-adenine methylase